MRACVRVCVYLFFHLSKVPNPGKLPLVLDALDPLPSEAVFASSNEIHLLTQESQFEKTCVRFQAAPAPVRIL
jgi:hypothetical protein